MPAQSRHIATAASGLLCPSCTVSWNSGPSLGSSGIKRCSSRRVSLELARRCPSCAPQAAASRLLMRRCARKYSAGVHSPSKSLGKWSSSCAVLSKTAAALLPASCAARACVSGGNSSAATSRIALCHGLCSGGESPLSASAVVHCKADTSRLAIWSHRAASRRSTAQCSLAQLPKAGSKVRERRARWTA